MEYWDVLDKDGNKTGKRVLREKRGLLKGEYHLVVHIWVLNNKGEFLLQKRSEKKHLMPGEWAATGGSVVSGEGSRHAAIRELSEELGIRVSRRQMVLVKRQLRKYSINDIYGVRCNVNLNNVVMQEDEVSSVMWASPQKLKEMIANGEFHNYGNDYFNIIFTIDDYLKKKQERGL